MIVTGDTTDTTPPAERQAGQHRAARRARTLWSVRPVGGRRRAGVAAAAAPAPAQLDVERAERFHTYGITR